MPFAGLSPAGALIVRSGEPFAVRLVLRASPSGDPQSFIGRSFLLAFRLSSQTDPFADPIPFELASDGLSAFALATAGMATSIHQMGQRSQISYDIVEVTNGASTTRWTERVAVAQGPSLPSDIVPMVADLPVSEILLTPYTVAVSERGAQGFAAERRLYDAGEIEQPTVPSLIAWIRGLVTDAVNAVAELLLGPGGLAIPRDIGTLAAVEGVDPNAELILGINGEVYRINALSFGAQFGGGDISVPKINSMITGIMLTDVPQMILPPDQQRTGAFLQCPDADVVIGIGEPPSFDSYYPVMYDGPPVSTTLVARNAIYARARWSERSGNSGPISVPLSLVVERAVGGPPPTVSFADTLLIHWPDDSDAEFFARMRTAINTLYDADDWSALTYLFVPGASEANNKVNLANPTGPAAIYYPGIAGIVTTPYGGVAGGGGDAYIDTQLFPDALGWTASSHALFAQSRGTTVDSTANYVSGLDGTLCIQPNRTATTAGFRDSTAGSIGPVSYPIATGELVGFSRLSSTEFAAYHGATLLGTHVAPQTPHPLRSLKLLGVSSTSGGSALTTTVPLLFEFAGPGMDAALIGRIIDAFAPVLERAQELREGGA